MTGWFWLVGWSCEVIILDCTVSRFWLDGWFFDVIMDKMEDLINRMYSKGVMVGWLGN